jgi:hypothetical protein
MTDAHKVGKFEGNCCEIELSEADRATFGLDRASVLLEVRPHGDLYGVFYDAKGLQWDVWSDHGEEHRGIAYAMEDPLRAASELLRQRWRPDFEYDPEEDG